MSELDYYDVLQVSSNADMEVIQAAYRTLARKFHPDANGPEASNDKMKLVNEAYRVLSDPRLRSEYDDRRRGKTGTRSRASRRSEAQDRAKTKETDQAERTEAESRQREEEARKRREAERMAQEERRGREEAESLRRAAEQIVAEERQRRQEEEALRRKAEERLRRELEHQTKSRQIRRVGFVSLIALPILFFGLMRLFAMSSSPDSREGVHAVITTGHSEQTLVEGSEPPEVSELAVATHSPSTISMVLSPTRSASPSPTPSATPSATPEPTWTSMPTPAPSTATPVLAPYFTAAQALNVRAGPGTTHPIVGSLMAGENRDVIGTNQAGDWLQIVYKGRPSWVSASLVDLHSPASISIARNIPTPPSLPLPLPPSTPTPSNRATSPAPQVASGTCSSHMDGTGKKYTVIVQEVLRGDQADPVARSQIPSQYHPLDGTSEYLVIRVLEEISGPAGETDFMDSSIDFDLIPVGGNSGSLKPIQTGSNAFTSIDKLPASAEFWLVFQVDRGTKWQLLYKFAWTCYVSGSSWLSGLRLPLR
jgi:curved DNA-binding protein CbpA/uncharacterized protein YraI